MRKLTKIECKRLLENPNVLKTTTSHVIYKPSFKVLALKLNEEGMLAKDIFASQGLNFNFFNEHYFKTCIKRWKRIKNESGEKGLIKDNRGRSSSRRGRPRKEKDIKTLSVKELQTLVQVQYEVIEELKKRKALAKKK